MLDYKLNFWGEKRKRQRQTEYACTIEVHSMALSVSDILENVKQIPLVVDIIPSKRISTVMLL